MPWELTIRNKDNVVNEIILKKWAQYSVTVAKNFCHSFFKAKMNEGIKIEQSLRYTHSTDDVF